MTCADISERFVIPYKLVKSRARAGWSGDRIVSVPDHGSGLKEGPIQAAVRAALTQTGNLLLWRNQVGAWTVGTGANRRHISYGLGIGSADLIGILKPTGRFISFEVKSESGKVTKEQLLWHAAVRAAGGFVAVVRTPAEALDALTRALAGSSE
jgi:hypothetical protein